MSGLIHVGGILPSSMSGANSTRPGCVRVVESPEWLYFDPVLGNSLPYGPASGRSSGVLPVDSFGSPEIPGPDSRRVATCSFSGHASFCSGRLVPPSWRPLIGASAAPPDSRDRGCSSVQCGHFFSLDQTCLLYTSPSPRDLSTPRMPSSA